jgi:hypothetical protein
MKPKIYSLVLIMFFITIINCQAQDSSISAQDSAHLGIQIGGNLSAIGSNSTSNLGFNIGLYLNYSLSNVSDIQIEFWYIQKGSLWEWGDSHINYLLSYLQLPVYYSYRLFQREKMADRLNFQLGPFFSYAVLRKSEEVYEMGGGGNSIVDIIKKYDYGISFCLQFFPKNKYYIRLIYDYSLSHIFKTSENITHVDASTAKMWSLIIFIGYEYNGAQ